MDHKLGKFISLFLVFILINISAHSYNLRQITNRDGLSNSSITSLCQDHTGMLWIGTCDGLDMYNGKTVTVYKPKDNNNILSGNVIDRIVETDPGILWIQTYYGLNKFDKKNNTLEHFNMFNKILFTEKDQHSNFFILQEDNSIYYYQKDEKKFEKINIPGLVFNKVLNLAIDSKNRIWIFNNDGTVICFLIQQDDSGEITLEKKPGYKHEAAIRYAFNDNGTIFFIDEGYNLYKFDFQYDNPYFVIEIKDLVLRNGQISSILSFHNDYFIGFKTNGLFILRKDSTESDKYTIETTPVNCGIFSLLQDKYQDVVWIGTDGQGVYSYANNRYSIRSTQLSDFSLRMSRPVRALFLDKESTLWIGSKGDGILKVYNYDITRNILNSRIERLTAQNTLLEDNSVYSLAQSRKNILWIGSEEGLNYYSYREQKIKKVSLRHNGLDIKYIHDIYEQDSVLWLASVGMGAVKAKITWRGDDPTLTVLNRFVRSDGDISSNYFFALYPEEDRYIWFANRGGGIFKVNTETFGVESIKFPDEIGNKTINEIFSITKDKLGNYLIGTSLGLIKYRSADDYKVFNTTNGFPNNTIHGILDGGNNNFWLSTNRGVINYNSEKDIFRTYESLDGLSIFEFSDGASFKDNSTGILYFGGINGFISIKENDYQEKVYMPQILFEDISIFGENHNITELLVKKGNTDILELDYNQNFFSVSFIAIDYINGSNHKYFYKLEGLNDQWIDNGNSNIISFTNFPVGEYNLLVKYYDRTHDLESEISSVRIRMLPPWYQSNLAYSVYWLLAVLFIAALIRWIVMRNKKKQVRMMRQIEQKHKEEIYESKLRFFTNIAHEFCTPLTLIYGPCTQILNRKGIDGSVSRYARVIQQNAERLNSLILDLIEFRRVESGYKKPKIEEVDVIEVTSQVTNLFIAMAETNNIEFEKVMPESLTWNSDKGFLVTIMTNLISNAFKYTRVNGQVKVSLSEEKNNLNIVISNTGKGMKQEDISRIFDRYSILDDFENQEHSDYWSRNGLGLAISNSMINLLQGSVNVESSPNEWTHFIISLPYMDVENNKPENTLISPVSIIKVENSLITTLPKAVFEEGKPTILVIDDEIEMLWLINEIFVDEFNVVCIDKPLEIFSFLNEMHPDIILCDVMMTGTDGISLTREIKANSQISHIPLVLISANHDVSEQIEGINAGAEIYITKPFNVDYLKSSVKQLMNRKEALKDYFSSPLSAFELAKGKLTHKEHKKLLKDIHDIINKNIRNKDLSVGFIADKMNMSTRNLYRKMEEISDISITDMIRDSRLHIGADLLVKSKLTIDEIIFKSGFANRVSFFKAFSKKYGCTPKEFRENNTLT